MDGAVSLRAPLRMTSPRRLAVQAWLAAKQAAAAAVVAAVKPVIEAVVGPPKKRRRRDGERWTDPDTGRPMIYWPDARDEPDRVDYLSPGGARRALDRLGRRRDRW